MLRKIGLSLVVCTLVSCASAPLPTPPTYLELAEANEALKMGAPEYITYTVKGLSSVSCEGGQCVMSESDFRQNQHDKRQLLNLHKTSHQADVAIARAYNTLVDILTLEQMAAASERDSAARADAAFQRERSVNLAKAWAERATIGLLMIGAGAL